MFSYDDKTKILSGMKVPPFYHPNVTIGQVIMHYLQREPSRIVQSCYDDGVDLSAGEMAKLASRIAGRLTKEGFKFGDVIGLVAKNTTYVAPVVLGCFLVGCPVSTLDPTFDSNEVANIFRQTKPKLVFSDHDNYDVVVEALKNCNNDSEVATVDESLPDVRHVTEMLEISSGEQEFMPRSFGVESAKVCSAILCSSGTTGLSKGVMLSSSQFLRMTGSSPLLRNPVNLCFSSLYWLSGMASLVNSLASVSRRVITKSKFSPILMVQLIEKYKVEAIVTPPSQVALLLQSPEVKSADLTSIRLYSIGGGFLSKSLRMSLLDHLPNGTVVVSYGMTELGGLAYAAVTPGLQKPSHYSGKVIPNVMLKVVDDDGHTLDANEVGEIYAKTENKFLGYANNSEATLNAYAADGWLKTGDLGYFTKDGEIFIVDRKKDMIKYQNYQVAPSELENCIQKMEGVKMVCVVGLPDMISGELAAAMIVKENNSLLTEQDVVDEIAMKFPIFKQLHGGAFFCDSLPMTASGKVKKFEARKVASELFEARKNN